MSDPNTQPFQVTLDTQQTAALAQTLSLAIERLQFVTAGLRESGSNTLPIKSADLFEITQSFRAFWKQAGIAAALEKSILLALTQNGGGTTDNGTVVTNNNNPKK